MQAPPKRDPLRSASQNQLNSNPPPEPSSRKRKRAEDDDQNNNLAILPAHAFDAATTPQSAVFTGITALSRADLPLIWVEQTSTSTELPAGYKFKSPYSFLEQLKNKHVMLARLNPNGRLYALEAVCDDAFIAVLLQHWVTEEMALSLADTGSARPPLPPLETNKSDTSRGHSRAGSASSARSLPAPTPSGPRKPVNRRGAIARAAIMGPRANSRPSPTAGEVGTGTVQSPQEIEQDATRRALLAGPHVHASAEVSLPIQAGLEVGPAGPSQPASPSNVPVTELGTLEKLRLQYLETLYLSRTSLAFYAKGSLARARGQVRDPESGLTAFELKNLYDSGILTSKKMEKKYKESIPDLLKEISIASSETKNNKRKAKQGLKLGKNGLWTGEDELLKKWWDHEVTTREGSRELDIKMRVADLRMRDTEMQVLLILEALILDTAAEKPVSKPADATESMVKVEPPEEPAMPLVPEARKKAKSRNYVHELETLLDRMCIWHAVTTDDFIDFSERPSTNGGSTDRLKDFCADVIIPFYASKLPVPAKIVCKKLRGPNISPQRPKMARASSKSHLLKATQKTQIKSTTKTSLQRVLSEDQDLRHASPPVLSRLSSDTRRSSIKREPSDTMSRPTSRAGMQKAVSFTNREVDLEADARTYEAKKRKLDKVAAQKRELAAAIQALKRPNRTTAAKEMMDEAEIRTAAKNAVQITATPRKGQNQGHAPEAALYQPFISAPRSDPVVPSSAIKPNSIGISWSSVKKRAVLDAIHDTPSRGEARMSDPLNLGRGSLGGPLVAASPSTGRTRPSVALGTPLQTKMSRSGKSVLFTPIKRSDVTMEEAFRDAPEIPEKAGKAMDRVMGGKGFSDQLFSDSGIGSSGGPSKAKDRGLYAQLGWDDDFDDL